MTTVRSKLKGDQILAAHPSVSKEQLSYVVVPDIAKEGAFDQVMPRSQAERGHQHAVSSIQCPTKDTVDFKSSQFDFDCEKVLALPEGCIARNLSISILNRR